MIHGEIRGGEEGGPLDQMADRMAEIRGRLDDLAPLGESIRAAIVKGLTRMARDGTDSQGRRLAPLAESTRRKPGHDGEPLRDHGAPAFIDSLRVEVRRLGSGKIAVSAYFTHPAARVTAEGTRHQPARDVFHPDPQTMAEVGAIVRDFARSLIGGGGTNLWGHRRLL